MYHMTAELLNTAFSDQYFSSKHLLMAFCWAYIVRIEVMIIMIMVMMIMMMMMMTMMTMMMIMMTMMMMIMMMTMIMMMIMMTISYRQSQSQSQYEYTHIASSPLPLIAIIAAEDMLKAAYMSHTSGSLLRVLVIRTMSSSSDRAMSGSLCVR
jgi:hypothetical protein